MYEDEDFEDESSVRSAPSKGPATRLEWGARYVRGLIELTPEDLHRIEMATTGLIGELEAKPETFHGRSASVLTSLGKRVREWSEANQPDVLERLRQTMDEVCAKLPDGAPERSTCSGVFASDKPASA